MKNHEFSKYEIATYLRDYNRTMVYAIMNQDVPLYEVFKHHMEVDERIQYSIKDYYYEMISIYEMLLLSKFLTLLYDNYFDNLLESKINKFNISDDIFINSGDRLRFSNKQIIKLIRNALNHNDNPNHDLVRFIRVDENGKESVKIEILLKHTKPIPFHVLLDINELMSICFEIENANSIIIASNRSTKPIFLNSFNVNTTLNNIFLRKFFSRKKLTEEQKESILLHIEKNNETKNHEEFFLKNGMEYKDFDYGIAQKVKVEEDLKYWESIGEKGNDVISHLLRKVMPFSWTKDRVLTMNLILSNCYMRKGTVPIFDLVKDVRQVVQSKSVDEKSPLFLYAKSFGIDDNMLYDAIDFENLVSVTNAIYYGYIFDTLVMDDEIKINDTRVVKREKIRDSFVHMRWFKGVKECFKLFDWGNGIDDEYNKFSKDFWQANIKYADMEKCAEAYFQLSVLKRTNGDVYMDSPIHFKKEDGVDNSAGVTSISFIKDGIFYYFDISNMRNGSDLLVCDESQIQRLANEKEKETFIDEFNNLSKKEKEDYSEKIEEIKNYFSQIHMNSSTRQ